jgi:hypothetical protein
MGANAQTSVPVFTAGQVLTAAQVTQINTGTPVFSSATTRDAAFGGAGEKTLAEGQTAFLEDLDRVQVYVGTSWQSIHVGSWTSYTPTVGAASGTITTASGTGAYALAGKLVIARFNLTITTNGTGGTAVTMTLPFAQSAAYATNQTIGVCREGGITGNLCQVGAAASGVANIFTSVNAYPGANGATLIGSMFYEVA